MSISLKRQISTESLSFKDLHITFNCIEVSSHNIFSFFYSFYIGPGVQFPLFNSTIHSYHEISRQARDDNTRVNPFHPLRSALQLDQSKNPCTAKRCPTFSPPSAASVFTQRQRGTTHPCVVYSIVALGHTIVILYRHPVVLGVGKSLCLYRNIIQECKFTVFLRIKQINSVKFFELI